MSFYIGSNFRFLWWTRKKIGSHQNVFCVHVWYIVSAVTQFLLMFHFISTFLKYSSAVLCGRMLHNVSSLLINTMKFFYKLNFLRRYLFRYVVCFNVVRLRCIWCRFGKSSRDIDITIASYSLLFFYNWSNECSINLLSKLHSKSLS